MILAKKFNPILVILRLLCFLLTGISSMSQLLTSEFHDETIMFALYQEIGVPGWGINGSDYCNWPGIRCSHHRTVEILDLSGWRLRGNITLITKLKGLRWLDLSNNHFSGSIPNDLGNLSKLEFLDLSSNKFENLIPKELGLLKNLKSLNISYNMLMGQVPDELKGLEKMQEFQISGNNLNGSIPKFVGNLSNLRVFAAYENDLSGEIPDNLGSVSELELLNLQSNQLEGVIPEGIFARGKLESLVLTENKLSGKIPESVGKCKNLSNIRIGNNGLEGEIPKSVGNISSLTYFEAIDNNLSGEIPIAFAHCLNLTLLNLASNRFSRIIPFDLGELVNLQELILSSNDLSGEIPETIFRCKNLNKVDLSDNRLIGTIPENICNMSSLQFLLLGQNSISGEIPHQIGNCIELLELQLSFNRLTGLVPPEIGRLKNLQIALNLSFNHLHGPIPNELGKLDKLVALDISSNQLSGSIPVALKGMLSLIRVNFSNNRFKGPVPVFVPFQKSPSSTFLGNEALCGEPLNEACDIPGDNDQNGYSHKVSYKIALVVIGSGLAVFVSVTLVVLLFIMREQQERTVKDIDQPLITVGSVFVDNLRQEIDFDTVVKATFRESNQISTGTFSSIYKATMPSGLVLLVRSLKSVDKTIIHHQSKMIRELERLGRLCHDHLLRPIGFVIYEDVALCLHEYMENGNLGHYIHEKSKKPELEPDWSTRLEIAIGVAEGITFLHNVAIIHLDISSGNVLLDANMRPRVAEIEISKLLDPSRGTASISAVAGSIGYIPPEYAYTMQVTAPGNVYSYGVILLEILTTRLPVDEAFGEGSDLVKWVRDAPARGEMPEQILDTRLSTVSYGWRKEMLATLKVALECTNSTPAKRPKMNKVVEMLQEIKQQKL